MNKNSIWLFGYCQTLHGSVVGMFSSLVLVWLSFYEEQQTKHPVFRIVSPSLRGIITEIAKVPPISVRSCKIPIIIIMFFFKVLLRRVT